MTLKEEIKKKHIKELEELAEFSKKDAENAHLEADNILLKYCPTDIAEAWMKVNRWYS